MVVDTIQHVHISTTPAAAPRLVVAAASVSTIPKASTGKFPAPQAEAWRHRGRQQDSLLSQSPRGRNSFLGSANRGWQLQPLGSAMFRPVLGRPVYCVHLASISFCKGVSCQKAMHKNPLCRCCRGRLPDHPPRQPSHPTTHQPSCPATRPLVFCVARNGTPGIMSWVHAQVTCKAITTAFRTLLVWPIYRLTASARLIRGRRVEATPADLESTWA